jgi:uncharacterized membrane protein YozB (DUF420 family)
MNNFKKYAFEFVLVFLAMFLSITGFWEIYFGKGASPTPYQNLHVITISIWLGLLLYQLNAIRKGQFQAHKKMGLLILFMGPLLVATTALLSVHSAHKGVVSGKGDALIVQNVMGTFELGLIILLAFIFKKYRKLHGAFLLSTALLFIGIALFFTLISFVPSYKIEGPETFYRFAEAGITSSNICLLVGFLFFLKDWRNGWPLFLAGSLFTLNSLLNLFLSKNSYVEPLTEFVGSLNQAFTFVGSFVVVLALLITTGIAKKKHFMFWQVKNPVRHL